ncbi:hypothetical protein SPRG_08081 [Saprolegnia parasitica CBS 223.65]|uniref:Uncharacterized protein n=1 Tax=Saprolegnia parasitica (strain CBS 223.65) TaxID=695850 RepID=A0A067CJT3_SAPPC|nr:hypothetical protein SPRG_08081 [Saprolegnia parasitica CBS 223.65]KDO26791.1 hypothetical protein SPRG_08081 [Saprolegnia parasitica CBS 223.65]|eukprot:XP_012202439.1 hypothetical protein SPRG_08081 [Saprolegnia parasitica CBS 223.65]
MPALLLPSLQTAPTTFALPTMDHVPAPAIITPSNATVLGWDDFLCPSTWLHQTQAIHPNQLTHPALLRQLANLDMAIVSLLTQARTLGPIFVVAENVNAMHALCVAFLPQTLALLSSSSCVCVMSASATILDDVCVAALQVSSSVFAPAKSLIVAGQACWRHECARMRAPVLRKVIASGHATPSVDEARESIQRLSRGLLQVVAAHTTALDMTL